MSLPNFVTGFDDNPFPAGQTNPDVSEGASVSCDPSLFKLESKLVNPGVHTRGGQCSVSGEATSLISPDDLARPAEYS